MFKSMVVEFQGLSEQNRKGFKRSVQVEESYCNRLYRNYSMAGTLHCPSTPTKLIEDQIYEGDFKVFKILDVLDSHVTHV